MLASDRELPVSGGPEKRAYVRDIFTAIAPTYDRLNRIISLRFDQRWRRYAVRTVGVGAAAGRNLPRPLRGDAGLRGHPGDGGPGSGDGSSAPISSRRMLRLGRQQGARAWRRSRPTRSSCRSPMPRSMARWSGGACGTWWTSTRARRGRPRASPRRPSGDPRHDAAATAACCAGLRVLFPARAALGRPTDLETYDRVYLVTRVDDRFPAPAELARRLARAGVRRRVRTGCSWAACARCTWGRAPARRPHRRSRCLSGARDRPTHG